MSRILVIALLAIVPVLADDPVVLEVGEAVPIPEIAAFVGTNGVLQAIQMLDEGGNWQTALTVTVGLDVWSVDHFLADPATDPYDAAGARWIGIVNGQPCAGTIRVMLDDPYTTPSMRIVQFDGAGVPATTVTLSVPTEAVTPDPVVSWPYRTYCGCDNLNTLCASDMDCRNMTGCPSGSGQSCHFITIFDPWNSLPLP